MTRQYHGDMKFRVRVHLDDASSVILRADSDTIGIYAVVREASGRGFQSVPDKRISLDQKRLKPLPPGSDADYEYTGAFPGYVKPY